ncbi:hypothetical protein E2562_039341 [Oryza meyeriana var. granulata]|uniref:Uncharacterized protein n=1 Tax=Oryza meyeriana var. granulata TaxID=110450 RepID=A0A6G1EUI0_9ORYZ|nr:hypothetical protein E2562_039341 [Oryza meyeriana var. granulata]
MGSKTQQHSQQQASRTASSIFQRALIHFPSMQRKTNPTSPPQPNLYSSPTAPDDALSAADEVKALADWQGTMRPEIPISLSTAAAPAHAWAKAITALPLNGLPMDTRG